MYEHMSGDVGATDNDILLRSVPDVTKCSLDETAYKSEIWKLHVNKIAMTPFAPRSLLQFEVFLKRDNSG